MARQILLLENLNPGRGPNEPIRYHYVLWLSVPVARQPYFANAAAASALSLGPNKATTTENTAIQNGSIVEKIDVLDVPAGTTLAQIQALLQTAFTNAQASLNASSQNLWDHYGSSFDGTSWTLNVTA